MTKIQTSVIRLSAISLLLLINILPLLAQQPIERDDKFFSVSGFGLSFPAGATKRYLGPKFSTTIGGLLALGQSHFFFYPKASLHAFTFNEIIPDPGYNTTIKDSRATTYLANMNLGYRKTTGSLGYYVFLGGGGGLVLTPRVKLDITKQVATLNNKVNVMPTMESGAGVDYALGFTLLFVESSYMRGFNKIQGRVFQSIPVTFGMKTNLSKVFYKLIK